jgi:hypothetical protein
LPLDHVGKIASKNLLIKKSDMPDEAVKAQEKRPGEEIPSPGRG